MNTTQPWTVTPGTVTLANGKLVAARRVDYADPERASEYVVTIPMRGALVDRPATAGQRKTFQIDHTHPLNARRSAL